ncbi:Prokaryotic metallothionein [Sciscionella sediminilitoris]|uniref:Prokaryotic metallothionein n=1 Tax=Sciscionella sediminilitoris TaxID=1445613 RepID=UPI0009EC7453|nr:Prokaryotic metallothionein [Sciscionella sp. SE31]
MSECEVCGNDYALTFEVRTQGGGRYVFDSFECAVHLLAPICEHCSCRVIGHGVQVEGRFFCCAHCARRAPTPQGEKAADSVGGGA